MYSKIPQFIIPFLMLLSFSCAEPPTDTQEQLNALTQVYTGGIALGWVDEDGIALYQSGQFSDDDPRPITPDTQFEIGSVTKVFTALLLSESERLGRVCRHDPAAKYLLHPDDPDQASLAKITLFSLATHTSGLPRMPSNFGNNSESDGVNFARYDRAMLIEALRAQGPYAPVGLKVVYSNFGLSLLGEALASAWGTSYEEALNTYVLHPLGMNDTTLAMPGKPVPPLLAPAHLNNTNVMHWTFISFSAAGGLLSSSSELVRFVHAALGNCTTPLHEAFVDTTKPQFVSADSVIPIQVGLGWFIINIPDTPILVHEGTTLGFRCLVLISQKERKGAVLIYNNVVDMYPLGFRLLGVTIPAPVSWAVANALDYVGRYWLTPNMTSLSVDITEDDGALFGIVNSEIPDGENDRCSIAFLGIKYIAARPPRWALRRIASDKFSIIDAPAEISFRRVTNGQVVGLTLHYEKCDTYRTRTALPNA